MLVEWGDLVFGGLLEDETTLVGVRVEWDVGFRGRSGWGVEMQYQIVCEGGGKDQRGAFDGEHDGGFEEAGDVFGVGGTQRWWNGGLYRGETDDQDRLGVVEGGWRVEAQVKGLLLREGDGRDVLVLGGVQVAHDADEVDDGADIGGVEATTGEVSAAGGVDEVGVGAAGEGGDDGLAVAVVEQGLRAGLGEAGELDVDGLFEAVWVGL